MAAGKINLQANDGKILGLYAPDGMNANTDTVPANINGDATKTFKVSDAVNADEALAKGQLLTEMKAVDGAGSGLDADLLRGYTPDTLPAGIGVGQTWQNVTASRSAGVTYTNTTGKPIFVKVVVKNTVNATSYVDNIGICNHNTQTDFTVIVPNGSTYILAANVTFYNWSELR